MKFLFDLGGVFFDWDPEYYFKNILKDKSERQFFLQNVCNDDWNIKQDNGRLIKEAEEELILNFPKYSKEIKLYYKNHKKMFKKIFESSVEVLKKLKEKKYQCYVLSNWSWETFEGMNNDYPFLNLFDGMIISGKEKMIKPNKNIYTLAISRFNLNPQETVFIDDKIENIETAINIGFKTIHLIAPELISDKINKFL